MSVEVFDGGSQRTGVALLELAAGQKVARLLAELFPDLKAQEGGFVRVRSNGMISGLEFLGDHALGYMAAIPEQVLVE